MGDRISKSQSVQNGQMHNYLKYAVYLIGEQSDWDKRLFSYGGILLPPSCKINYVNMQHNYVDIRLIYVDMQHNDVDMHVINFCQIFFSTGKFSY